jgi:hypothetical protein
MMTEERLWRIQGELEACRPGPDLMSDKEAWAEEYGQYLIDALRAAWRERDELRAVATEAQRSEAGFPANRDSGRSVLDFLAGGRPWSYR